MRRMATLLVLGAVALVLTGVLRGWRWQVRAVLHGVWLGLLLLVFVKSGCLALANLTPHDLWNG